MTSFNDRASEFGPGVSGPIQVFPPGLLSFLNLKNTGQNPHSLDLRLQPVLELGPWMFEGVSFHVAELQVVVADGTVGYVEWASPGPYVVPQDSWDYVLDYTSRSGNLVATDETSWVGAWQYPFTTALSTYMLASSVPVVTGPAAGARRVCSRAGGFWLPPRSALGLWFDRKVGAQTTFGYVRIARFKS